MGNSIIVLTAFFSLVCGASKASDVSVIEQGPPDQEFSLEGGIELKKVEILGTNFDRGLFALRVVTQAVEIEESDESGITKREPYNCGYSGMKSTPYDGVALVLWDTKQGAIEKWHIYKATYLSQTCVKPAESKKRLTQAKTTFAKLGLDISKVQQVVEPPGFSEIKIPVSKTGSVKFSVKTFQDDVCEDSNKISKKEKKVSISLRKKMDACHCEGDRSDGLVVHGLTLNTEKGEVYRRWDVHSSFYGGSGNLNLLGAVVNGNRVVFIEMSSQRQEMKGSASDSWSLSISPVLDLTQFSK